MRKTAACLGYRIGSTVARIPPTFFAFHPKALNLSVSGSIPITSSVLSKKTLVAGERRRRDVARRRAQWLKYRDRVDPTRLVFIDETWTRPRGFPYINPPGIKP